MSYIVNGGNLAIAVTEPLDDDVSPRGINEVHYL